MTECVDRNQTTTQLLNYCHNRNFFWINYLSWHKNLL